MQIHAIVPVKLLQHAKSRLSKRFSNEERKELVITMLSHVISILQSCKEIAYITIVSPDPLIKDFAEKVGVNVFSEEKSGYNESLTAAAAKIDQSHTLLTIAADLPLLTKKDVQTLVKLSNHHDVVLAPSKDNGTNALILRSPLLMPYLFGINSYEVYKNEAQKRELSLETYHSNTLAFDIDTVDDIDTYKKLLYKDQL